MCIKDSHKVQLISYPVLVDLYMVKYQGHNSQSVMCFDGKHATFCDVVFKPRSYGHQTSVLVKPANETEYKSKHVCYLSPETMVKLTSGCLKKARNLSVGDQLKAVYAGITTEVYVLDVHTCRVPVNGVAFEMKNKKQQHYGLLINVAGQLFVPVYNEVQ